MQVHQRPGVFHHPLSGVDERLGEFGAVVDVVAASPPVEIAPVVAGSPSLVAVAVADLQLPLTAGPGNGVDHSRRRDGVHERRLAAACVRGKSETLSLNPSQILQIYLFFY